MAVYLVRHGSAGDKYTWSGPDAERPLDEDGVHQARSLADALDTAPVRRIVTSPTARCRETVEPLAHRLGLPVDEHDGLRPVAGPRDLRELLTALDAAGAGDGDGVGDVVLCTHGELLRPLLTELRRAGTPITARHDDDDWLLAKGTAWRLTLDPTGRPTVVAVEHVAPAAQPDCPAPGP